MANHESKLKRRIVERFTKAFPDGWHSYLVPSGGQRRGLPDLWFILPGTTAFLEAKMEGNRLSANQRRTLTTLARGGLRVAVVTGRLDGSMTLTLWNGEGCTRLVRRLDVLDANSAPQFFSTLFTA